MSQEDLNLCESLGLIRRVDTDEYVLTSEGRALCGIQTEPVYKFSSIRDWLANIELIKHLDSKDPDISTEFESEG